MDFANESSFHVQIEAVRRGGRTPGNARHHDSTDAGPSLTPDAVLPTALRGGTEQRLNHDDQRLFYGRMGPKCCGINNSLKFIVPHECRRLLVIESAMVEPTDQPVIIKMKEYGVTEKHWRFVSIDSRIIPSVNNADLRRLRQVKDEREKALTELSERRDNH